MKFELYDFYTAIINSIGLKIDENGVVYRTSLKDEKIPIKIGQKLLSIFPLFKIQENYLDKHILFYPIWEDAKDDLPSVHLWLSNEMSSYLNNYIWKILDDLLLIIAHPQEITNNQDLNVMKLYRRHVLTENSMDAVTEPDIESAKKFICEQSIKKQKLIEFITLPENISEQDKFTSRTKVYWGGLDKLLTSNQKGFELLGKKGKQLMYKLITFILGDDYFKKYSRISSINAAPHLHSLLLAYLNIAERLNESILTVKIKKLPERVKIEPINTNFGVLLQKLPQYKKIITYTPENDNKQPIIKQIKFGDIKLPQNTNTKFDENTIKWLRTNHRACYWFWLKLMKSLDPTISNSEVPASNERRYRMIKNYYVRNPLPPLEIGMIKLKPEWDLHFSNIRKESNWLENLPVDNRIWAVSYLEKHLKEKYFLISTNEEKYFKTIINAVENEQKLSLNIFIDNWVADIDIKRKFLKTMKQTYTRRNTPSRKLKKNNSNKKPTQYYIELNVQTYNDLLFFAEYNDKTLEQAIQLLIEIGMKNS